MHFILERSESSALTVRSIYTLKNLFRINDWGHLATSATVWVYKSNENHATGWGYDLVLLLCYGMHRYMCI